MYAIFHLPHMKPHFIHEGKTARPAFSAKTDAQTMIAILNTLGQAHEVFPENLNIITSLAVVSAVRGDLDRAVPLFEKAVQLHPNNVDYGHNLVRALLDQPNLPRADQKLSVLEKLAGDHPTTLQLRFKYHWQRADYKSAVQTGKRWNEIAPSEESLLALREAEKLAARTDR